MPRRLAALLGAIVLLAVALAAADPSPRTATAAEPYQRLDAPAINAGSDLATAAACTITRRYVRQINGQPAAGVTAFVPPGGASSTIDDQGVIRLGVDRSPASLRVNFPEPVFDVTEGRVKDRDGNVLPGFPFLAGSYDMTYRVYVDCYSQLSGFTPVRREEGSVSRPAVPLRPAGFVPSSATLAATIPTITNGGNAINVPWDGYFWLTAPVINAGVCITDSVAAAGAAALAIDLWKNAVSMPWQIVRDDSTCSDDYAGPRLVFKYAAYVDDPNVLGATPAIDLNGKACNFDLEGGTCWVKTATVYLNSAGFDRVTSERQVQTALHEMGHALGLAHTNACGDSVMWYTTRCAASPTGRAGADDVASVTELLAATLRVLQAPTP